MWMEQRSLSGRGVARRPSFSRPGIGSSESGERGATVMSGQIVAGFSLNNYFSAEEVCDWTGKGGIGLRVAEKESVSE